MLSVKILRLSQTFSRLRFSRMSHENHLRYTTSATEWNNFCGRTHHCGELRSDHVGQRVTLCGWLQYERMGLFMVLRDSYGLTQVTVHQQAHQELLKSLTAESVIKVEGVVETRPSGQQNKKMATGDVEVMASNVQVLNTCIPQLPFNVQEFNQVNEKLRMQHRHLDLRSSQLQRNLRLRSKLVNKIRHFLCDKHRFVDVETPTLFRKTPGGAQEFVVPTRIKGQFYSLPQSPQQFKQLLMIGGIDRYMQIARCYRDEHGKADRQPEFTQVDIEMSFVTQEDIKSLIEQMITCCWPEELTMVTEPFTRISYHDALTLYGTDKPDTRYDMKIVDVSNLVKNCAMDVLQRALTSGGFVRAINFKEAGKYITRKDIEALKTQAKQWEKFKSWHAIVKLQEGGAWPKSMSDSLGSEVIEELTKTLQTESGDLILLSAGHHYNPCEVLGRLRVEVANMLESKGQVIRDQNKFNFLWVEDFPLFLPKEEGEGVESAHHPFTAPHPEDVHLVYTDPLKVRSEHYDLVLNGSEIGGGSIRIHNSELQRYVIQNVLGEECDQLEHLLRALDHGCPPHGGIALGLDRLVAIACGAKSIRDVIAFPKSHEGRDLMAQAPAELSDADKAFYQLS